MPNQHAAQIPQTFAWQDDVEIAAERQRQQRQGGQNIAGTFGAGQGKEQQAPGRRQQKESERRRPPSRGARRATPEESDERRQQQAPGQRSQQQRRQIEPERFLVIERRQVAQDIVPPQEMPGKIV